LYAANGEEKTYQAAPFDPLNAAPAPFPVQLYVHGSKTRYHENSLYGSLKSEISHHSEIFRDEEDEEPSEQAAYQPSSSATNGDDPGYLLFASSGADIDLTKRFPSVERARQLWFIYKDRVDPLLKIFHTDHKQERFLAAIEDPESQAMSTQAFMFATYLFAVYSLSDEECLSTLGEARTPLYDRYRIATQQALIRAGILRTSDAIILQAYIMFLVCVATKFDAGTFWILSGIAVRIAQRGGLHRDQTAIGAETWPWHSEMRRRLWWMISMIDMRASEMTGLGPSMNTSQFDTKMPLNINDSDLEISMTELPEERTGATDMIHCLITYEIRNFYREVKSAAPIARALENFQLPERSMEDKDLIVDELERRLEHKFLRYCDPLVPLHSLCLITARAAVATSRLMIHYPRNQANESGDTIPQARKDKLFGIALKIIEYHNLVYDNKNTRKYAWQMKARFPWHALTLLLSELRTRTAGDVDRAWSLIEQFVEYNPEFVNETRKALHVACGNLTLKAWDARVERLKNQHLTPPKEPVFITHLRAKKEKIQQQTSGSGSCASTGAKPTAPPKPVANEQELNGQVESAAKPLTDFGTNFVDPMLNNASNATFDMSPDFDFWQWDDLISQNFDLVPAAPETANLFGPVPG
jgi:hypothetical protein